MIMHICFASANDYSDWSLSWLPTYQHPEGGCLNGSSTVEYHNNSIDFT